MQVCVMGAGVLGLTSAWYLQQAGCQVTLVEREASVAQGASYGNGGQLSRSLCAPWAAPGAVKTALASFFQPNGPLRIKLDGSYDQWRWMLMALRNSRRRPFMRNRAAMMALAQHSITEWHALQQQLPLRFDQRSDGIILTLQTQAQMENAKHLYASLQAQGHPVELLGQTQLLQREPGLQRSSLHFHGALRFSDESTADCAQFCHLLTEQLLARGVVFRLNTTVTALEHDSKKIHAIQTTQGPISADTYVIATGAWSPDLLKPLFKLPIQPVKGYALTAPITNPEQSVRSALLDDQDKVSIARFGQRLRITAFAEFDGFNTTLDEQRLAQLRTMYEARFPDTVDFSQAEAWCGFRPMTPDGTPAIGATQLNNLYLNTGHGTFGWTLACGSSQLLAQLLTQNEPALDPTLYSPLRYA